jgi:hypothetical protein
MLRHHPISTEHETIHFALNRPYSTLYTYIQCPGITQSPQNRKQFILPLFALVQPFTPIFNAQASPNHHRTQNNLFCPYLPLFNLLHLYSMPRHHPITTEQKTIYFALIRPYSTCYTYIQYPNIT